MIERVIENWLDKASEKAFQVPFCYILIDQGHTILHMTRHCGMEHGKDIITRNKDGEICAYQLKGAPGSKIKLRDWQQGILGQSMQLVYTPVIHPSVPAGSRHQSFFVTNGGLEEEVSAAINAQNQQWASDVQTAHLQLQTIVDGELKAMAKKLTYAFLPADLKDFKALLEFLLEDGNGCLNKSKLGNLIASVLTDETVGSAKQKERVNSAALLTAIALSGYINKKNHFAVFEGWMIYLAALLGYSAKQGSKTNDFNNEYRVGEQLALDALEDLWDEVKDRRDFMGESPMEDVFFHSAKRLLLIGLMSNLGIYRKMQNREFDHAALKVFIEDNLKQLDLWGESAVPHLLTVYWYLHREGSTASALGALKDALVAILLASKEDQGLIGPYYDADSCLDEIYNQKGKIAFNRYESFYLEAIIHLLTRHEEKDFLIQHWPQITHFRFINFGLAKPSDFFNWKNETGKEIWYIPKINENWTILSESAAECAGNDVPEAVKAHPVLYPLLLNVMPHRANTGDIRWFDELMNKKQTNHAEDIF